MRKIAELNGDEFFDVVYILSPILSVIANMDILQIRLVEASVAHGLQTEMKSLKEQLEQAEDEQEKQRIMKRLGALSVKVVEMEKELNDSRGETTKTFIDGMSNLVSLLSSKENRNVIFGILSILEKKQIEEIKQYPPPKLISRIKQVIADTDFKSFLTYAEPSEQTE